MAPGTCSAATFGQAEAAAVTDGDGAEEGGDWLQTFHIGGAMSFRLVNTVLFGFSNRVEAETKLPGLGKYAGASPPALASALEVGTSAFVCCYSVGTSAATGGRKFSNRIVARTYVLPSG